MENILQSRKHERSKADYYPKHLFLRVLCHSLLPDDADDIASTPEDSFAAELLDVPISASPPPMRPDKATSRGRKHPDVDRTLTGSRSPSVFGSKRYVTKEEYQGPLRNAPRSRRTLDRTFSFDSQVKVRIQHSDVSPSQTKPALQSRKDLRNLRLIQELLKGQRVNVHVSPMNILLFRDGAPVRILFWCSD